ncbi:MAG: transporter substrate-binding protein [Paracoccaceae bacterium]
MRRRVEIGLLFSLTGSYALLSQACREGALAAIAAVNADPAFDIDFAPVERDPGGNIDLYGPYCEEILRDTSARHVVGCITSWSRKEVIPTLEKVGGTLWYPAPYEGFESSDHVVYMHACPNQHLLPLLAWAFPRFGRRAYLTGSNYIWGWEINRLARETIATAGGEVLGERYLPIGSLDVGRMVDEIRVTRPDFILNSLIGPSQYRFLAAYHALSLSDPHFRPATCPVLSCNLTECELPVMDEATEGLIAAGPYFRDASANFGSSFEAAAYDAVMELARLLAHRQDAERESLARLLDTCDDSICTIDPKTHHRTLPVLIAQVRDGVFEVLERQPAVAGDPYLSRAAQTPAPGLRVVS